MAPDLSEKLLGIDIGDSQDQTRQTDDDQEDLEQFVFFRVGDDRLALPVDAVRTLAEVPDELTRVPRAPAAIEGMVDLRGEITAVIDPRVHFPPGDAAETATETDAITGQERLLVLDRPADQQSAALRTDEVLGVETIPESDVVDETAIDDGPLSGDALAHPLVTGLITQERTSEPDVDPVVASNRVEADAGGDAGGVTTLPAQHSPRSGADSAVGETFELEATEATPEAPDEDEDDATDSPREVIIEVTPLVDVETLLVASGRRE